MATYTIHGSGLTNVGRERKKERKGSKVANHVGDRGGDLERSTYVPRVRRRQTLSGLCLCLSKSACPLVLLLVLVLVQVRLCLCLCCVLCACACACPSPLVHLTLHHLSPLLESLQAPLVPVLRSTPQPKLTNRVSQKKVANRMFL